ncbi:MAG: ABC transporter ATP-binding protein [Acidobacteriota bacterium]|nr:ABC transporter ATP-binding protein [Acidobacteriota bacterium]
MSEILRLEHVTKSFGRRRILKDIGLSLESGKVYGLLGNNGEGKTTMIRIITGVIPAEGGRLFFRGAPIPFGAASHKTEIGYVPEDSFIYGWMKVGEFMDFNAAFYPGWDAGRAADCLKRFSLDVKARVASLSRGLKLKLHLAAALAARPALLILDDATSGIDVPTRRDFLKDIIGELADSETTVFFSTHMVHELERIVEHLFILHGGEIVLNEDYERIKDAVKRVVLRFDGDASEKTDIVYPWTGEKRQRLEQLSPARLEVEPLSLEEIFESFVKKRQERTPC